MISLKILIIRALQLGDLLCAVPAFKALRKAHPNAEIYVAGLPWSEEFCLRFKAYIDHYVWFPGYPGLPEQPIDAEAFFFFLQWVQEKKFDWVIQMQGSGTFVNPMVALFKANVSAGYYTRNAYVPDYTHFMDYPEGIHEIHRHLQLMAFLGFPSQGSDLEFPLDDHDQMDYEKLSLPVSRHQFVCIHPGSRGKWRQWPPDHFARLADFFVNHGLQVVVTGTAAEKRVVQEVIEQMRGTAINLAGATSVGAVAVLIKNAAYLVCNCTGVSHIAAALRTPSTVISMDGEPERWGPLDHGLHKTVDWTQNPDVDYVMYLTERQFLNGGKPSR